jgi:hypothetical protein
MKTLAGGKGIPSLDALMGGRRKKT